MCPVFLTGGNTVPGVIDRLKHCPVLLTGGNTVPGVIDRRNYCARCYKHEEPLCPVL